MTNSPRQGTATLAVLIDADNAAPAIIEGLLAEVAKYGVAAVKRIYGDWTKPNLSGWKECLLSHSIQPIQQFRYTVGKNATDSAMIIDAMDLLYTERFDGFCLVSSDSDFTRLASRIREQGLIVYGFGERKTPKPFVTACDKFIYSDVLRADAEVDEAATPTRRRSSGELRQDSRLVRLLQNASQAVSDDDGWSTLGGMGNHIAKQAPEFDSRNYGYGKLSELVVATGLFEVETRNGGNNKTIWVRLKKRSKQGQEGDGRHAGGQRQAEKPQAQPTQTPAPQPENRQPVVPPEVAAVPVAAPEPEPVREPVEVSVASEPVPEPAPVPEVEAPEVVAADVIAEESPAPAAKKPARKRAPRRPDVALSEKPWPIDQSVFAAPGDTVLTAQVQEAFEGFSEAAPVADASEAKPVRKTRRKVKS
ncbi:MULTISPECIES: NYN domain-containing protein [Cupriavidus]|uniref:HTH OST-type domain-containing protein n=1 Tax=Cupriavidus pinatubonensis (strain JMP 134 / LMG 1197) TaxID=264198 RepID=Q46W91_CUPPJ|nr:MULTISPECIES: NYN domain-containing protein [Cupriavidus]QYY31426.1 NYN domain-containing protein [Cupriavidus pinatubonensis]TPQ42626.1 NYN domain-containing protein [Cupriavidus pinatubonensis]